jgi:iron(III) transport system permease protein
MGKFLKYSFSGIHIFLLLVLIAPVGALYFSGTEWQSPYIVLALKKLGNTIWLATWIAGLSLGIGGVSGVILSFFRIPGTRYFVCSFAIAAIIPSYALAMLLGDISSSVLTDIGYIWVMTSVASAYTFFLVYGACNRIPTEMVPSLQTLGLGWIKIIKEAILPMIRPALTMAGLIAFADAFADFGAALHTGADTIVVFIYKLWFGGYLSGVGKTIVIGVFCFVFGLIFWIGTQVLHDILYQAKTYTVTRTERYPLPLWVTYAVLGGLTLLSIVTVWVPLWKLAEWGLMISVLDLSEIVESGKNSLIFSVGGSILLVLISLVILETTSNFVMRSVKKLSLVWYFIPGTVIAISVLTLEKGAITVPLGVLLLYAVGLKYLALPLGILENNQLYLRKDYAYLAEIYGKSYWWYIREVKFPLLWRGGIISGIVVFLELIKELPITLLLRPYGFDTMATRAFQHVHGDILYASAPWIIGIVGISGVATYIAHRLSSTK